MLFSVSKESQPAYELFLRERGEALHECNLLLYDVCRVVADAWRAEQLANAASLLLARHALERLDGVALLVGHGDVDPCGELLRSAFEAFLGLTHILRADSDRRAAAYLVGMLMKQKERLERLDPRTGRGKEFRRELANDIAGGLVEEPDADGLASLDSQFQRIKADLSDPLFSEASEEWDKARPQNWFQLFDGSRNLRSLAVQLHLLSLYEKIYGPGSDDTHGTGTIKHLAEHGDEIAVRPLRHPEGIERVVNVGGRLAIVFVEALLQRYPTSDSDTLVGRAQAMNRALTELAGVEAPKWTEHLNATHPAADGSADQNRTVQ